MARTEYFRWTTGATLYAKPLPLTDSAWGDDDVAFTENASLGSYSASLDEDTSYEVFVQSGGSPANTDLAVGSIALGEWYNGGRLDTLLDTAAAGAGGTGANTVNVTLSDDSANLVAGSVVNVQTSGGTMLGIYGTTNASGVVTFYLDDGSYKMVVSDRSGYDTHTAESVTVDEDPEAVALTVTASSGTPTTVGWVG